MNQIMNPLGIPVSVTQRVKIVKQPRGGYINPKQFESTQLGPGIEALKPNESISPILVGIVVDYLTRYMTGASVQEAFQISLAGAGLMGETAKAKRFQQKIRGLDDSSLVAASKLVGYDSYFRAGPMAYKPVEYIEPDSDTIFNIRTMVERSLKFFDQYGPKIMDGITFEGGYGRYISKGDADFTTKDTFWDFKVSKCPVTKEQTLQLLIYWRMGLRSVHPELQNIRYLGIYNPRLNVVYRYDTQKYPFDLAEEIDIDVIRN